MKLNHGWILMGCLTCLISLGCSDDDQSRTVLDTEKWVGAPCICKGTGCEILGIPMPVPTNGLAADLVGCDNIPENEGSAKVCLRTIPQEAADIAPPAYFPAGYCTLSAVGCQGDESICSMVRYGDESKMSSCPKGTSLLESTFDYSILGMDVVITNKTCAKNCNTNDDCNGDGEISCIEADGAKFCYNEKNFEFMNRGYSATVF